MASSSDYNYLQAITHQQISSLEKKSVLINRLKTKRIGERRLEAAQMKFLRQLLGITKLDKERVNVLGKNGSTEYSKGNKTVPGIVATTRTEDGHE